ncbi:transposase [Kribbella sp. NPDC003557]|uniref:transposase n=1 Tax=Kribbella sp. NPDC003557 TaxID=3154449 RepID=UPI0033B89D68
MPARTEPTSVLANREVIVDGTRVPTGNRAHSKHNYSSKRLRQGLNIQVAADADGTLLAVSAPVAGGRHDRRAITECGGEAVLNNYTWIADAPAGPPSNAPSATSRTGKYSQAAPRPTHRTTQYHPHHQPP